MSTAGRGNGRSGRPPRRRRVPSFAGRRERRQRDRYAAVLEPPRPRPGDAAFQQDRRTENPVPCGLGVTRVERRRTLAIRNRVLVVGRQQDGMRSEIARQRGASPFGVPVDNVFNALAPQARTRHLQRRSRVGGRQAGPPAEVAQRGRAVAREIAARDLRERLVAVERFRRAAPIRPSARRCAVCLRARRNRSGRRARTSTECAGRGPCTQCPRAPAVRTDAAATADGHLPAPS